MLTVIMPAYNESKNIESVLSAIGDYNVLVVDDGSTDNTSSVVSSLGYKVVRLENNCGKTRACIEGIRHSKSEFNIFIDSDGQLNPKEIPIFENALKNADIVIGERNMSHIPFKRRLNWSIFEAARRFPRREMLCVRQTSRLPMSFKKTCPTMIPGGNFVLLLS